MRILFDNKIKDATITSLTPNSNYSAPNLKSQFLRLKYKSLGFDDVVTIQFPDNISADSFFYGFSNAKSMTVKLYSNTSALLETLTVDCAHDSGSSFFARHDDVRRVTIEAASEVTEDLFIGGIGVGVSVLMPDPLATLAAKLENLSGSSVSGEGQVANRYIEPLRVYESSFNEVLKDVYYELLELFASIGTGHLWVDFTERNHSIHKPLYCTSKMVEGVQKSNTINFSINFTEAR